MCWVDDIDIGTMSQVDFKIILLGSQGVGKTSVFMRYIYGDFTSGPYKTTLGAVFGSKNVSSQGNTFSIGIWDTAGSERYYSMTKLYYRNAKAAVVCYDPYCMDSWERVMFWVQELRKQEEDCKVYICQTKKDLLDSTGIKPTVDRHDAEDYADSINAKFFILSSKTGENIDGLFQKIVDDLSTDPACMRELHQERERLLQAAGLQCLRERIASKRNGQTLRAPVAS